MMRLAPTHNFAATVVTGAGLLPRLRAWFARGAAAIAAAPCASYEVARAAPVMTRPVVSEPALVQRHSPPTATLLPFPIRGEALLVKLAELLRGRVAGRTSWHQPFLLTMSRAPCSRLTIDHASYVEFDPRRATYHVVVEAAPETTVMLDTTDFDALVQFVAQYVADRLSEQAASEAAS